MLFSLVVVDSSLGVYVQLAGGMFLPAEVMEKYVSNNRMGIFIAMMAANMVSGSILTTNAFEISHNVRCPRKKKHTIREQY